MIRTYATFLFCVFKQMKMSELGPDVSTTEQYQFSYNHLTLESTMAKLRIGQPCVSSSGQQTLDSTRLSDLMFPDFWRRTLANPISGHKDAKNFSRKKLLNEILRPAKFKFPLVNSTDSVSGNNACDKGNTEEGGQDSPSFQKLNGASRMSNVNADSASNSISAELRLNGITSPTIVTLPDFSSLSIRSGKKAGQSTTSKPLRSRPWRSNKYKSRFGSLKDYRSLRNALPPIPEVDIDDDDQYIASVDTCLADLNLTSSTNFQSVSAHQSCSQQALIETTQCSDDITIDELSSYFDVLVHIPKKMSPMAEMMYT